MCSSAAVSPYAEAMIGHHHCSRHAMRRYNGIAMCYCTMAVRGAAALLAAEASSMLSSALPRVLDFHGRYA